VRPFSLTETPFIPAQAGIQGLQSVVLGSRFRGNERMLLSIGAQVFPLRVGELARDELVEF
jgi:hypothetical protein